MLAAAAVGDVNPVIELTAALMGGGLAASTHATKAGTRALINTSPEPFSNWTASITEDIAVIVGLWTALNHPTLYLVLLGLFILLMIFLLPRLWRGIKLVVRKVRGFFGGDSSQETGVENVSAQVSEMVKPEAGKDTSSSA